jgi:hypothetical protein
MVSPRLNNGGSRWSIGYDQQDLNTNGKTAQSTLVSALVASGEFTDVTAQRSTQPFSNVETSSSVELFRLVDNVTCKHISVQLPRICSADSAE